MMDRFYRKCKNPNRLSLFLLLVLCILKTGFPQSPTAEETDLILMPIKEFREMVMLRTLPGQGKVEELAFSRDGQMLGIGAGNQIFLWDLQSFNSRALSIPGKIGLFPPEFSFGPGNKTLASVMGREIIALWDLTSGQPQTLEVGKAIFSIDFSRDGGLLATGSNSGGISIWETKSRKRIKILLKNKGESYSKVKFTPGGKSVVALHNDKEVVWVGIEKGNILKTYAGHEGYINSMALGADGKLLVTGSSDKSVIVWNLETGEKLQHIKALPGRIHAVDVSPSGKVIAAVIAPDLFPWDKPKPETALLIINTASNEIVHKSIPYCYAVAFSPKGDLLATGHSDGEKLATIWDIGYLSIPLKYKKDPFETTTEYESRVGQMVEPFNIPLTLTAGQYNADEGGFELGLKRNKILIRVEREKARGLTERKYGELKITGTLRYHNAENLKLVDARLMDTTTSESFEIVKTGEIPLPEPEKKSPPEAEKKTPSEPEKK